MVSFSSPVSILAIPAMWLVSYYPGFLKVCKTFELDFVAYSFELSHEGVCPEKSWWIYQVRAPAVPLQTDIELYFGFRSVQPRSNIARLSENKDTPPELVALVSRMEGAHLVCCGIFIRDRQFSHDMMT